MAFSVSWHTLLDRLDELPEGATLITPLSNDRFRVTDVQEQRVVIQLIDEDIDETRPLQRDQFETLYRRITDEPDGFELDRLPPDAERGMETLEEIGKGESTTFVLPQELTSLVGRYGKHLTGSDTKENGHVLEGLDFDDEAREMLGLDDIEEILGQIDKDAEVDVEEMEAQARAVKEGSAGADIKDPDELIEEMDQEIEDGTQTNGDDSSENA